MIRRSIPALVTLCAALALAPAAGALTQLELSVARDLREYGFRDVDVERLTPAQLAAIHHIASASVNEGEKRGVIRSILGGRGTLRGALGIGF